MMTVTSTDGEELAAFTHGDAEKTPLVLLHGYPDDHTVWERVVPLLSDDFYVVTYDARGAGESAHPASLSAYNLEQLSGDLLAVSEQVLGGRPFHLVGHDWGSIQSWESATGARFAGKILSFTTISGPSLDSVANVIRRRISRPRQLLKVVKPNWYVGAFHIPFLPEKFWESYSAEKWQQRVAKEESDPDIPINPRATDNGAHGIKLYRANFVPRILKPHPRKAICPVQAIAPAGDSFVHPALVKEMRRWVDDFTLTQVPGGHWAALSHPRDLAAAISRFATAHGA
ncbi:Haloacetate dehalogenase H-1 [Corynebacterium capitovis DSM 44611]|uniref:alpha/beta fold hydrolase n=1 Tax=Corynebacterium capitovis TaxID=131081 RepID=UPI00038112DB|nr:alpha/beta fold hydrolase [Corynebacterium capitovis]WKD58408.1 Haloacetate dehalogenase H-1 [Corynebacterium capitovis DSM 44611]